jgi:hypothetical protein
MYSNRNTFEKASRLRVLSPIIPTVAVFLLSGCATAPMTSGGSLSSYDDLSTSDGMLTKSRVHVNKDKVLAAKTIRIMPTAFLKAASPALSDNQRKLVANTVDRALCIGLSDRFQVVASDASADLTVHAVVTNAATTDEIAAGVSQVAGITPAVLGIRALVPRIPIGLGSLTVEAETQSREGKPQASMIWARGADSFTSSPRVSSAGDAYDLATTFGNDFSQLLVTGSSPFGAMPSAPSLQKISASFGGKAKYAACEAFGHGPGVTGMVAQHIGMPPEWTDDGAAPVNGPGPSE